MAGVKFAGTPMNLVGNVVKVGDKFRDFNVTTNDLKDFTLADTKGVRIFLAVPSIDTGVCDLEVRSFNEKVQTLDNVTCYTVSMDLPFAQARWCGNAGVDKVITLSDYKTRSFGEATGTFVKELALLARCSFVVDSEGVVVYAEYLEEITTEPSYDEIIAAAKNAK